MCGPPVCTDIPEIQCLATAVHLDIATGAITAVACECMDFNMCHIEFGDVSPFPVGGCPDGHACEVVASDTDNDGFPDHFTAECHPDHVGACCLDIDDGPVPFDTCLDLSEDACYAEVGVFYGVNSGCWDMEACCLGEGFCVELNPFCCLASGGVPVGPGSICAGDPGQNVCGQPCGGIASIPCDDPGEHCVFPIGACCCDYMGVCMPIVNECPSVWEPVCGCDGVTYENRCWADMAEMTVAHVGPCEDERLCGGLGPHPPCLPEEFCKFPPGTCDPTVPGVCTPIPGGCPDVWDPVCGCDGVTYGNECEADAAGVPIAHPGECGQGACCLPDMPMFPPCIVETYIVCADLGGEFQGPGTTCPTDPNVPCGSPTGACCYSVAGDPNSWCIVTTEPECAADGGVYFGDGTTCPTDPADPCGPSVGACCLPDGMCVELPWEACIAEGGDPHPAGAPCDPSICPGPSTGACCLQAPGDPDAWCVEATMEACHADGGKFFGAGTVCPPDGACIPPDGACCMPDGACIDLPHDKCMMAGGVPLPGVPCDLVYCGAPTGACCIHDAAIDIVVCIETTAHQCFGEGGMYLGDGTTCPSDPAELCGPPMGACCFPDGACIDLPLDVCVMEGGEPLPGAQCEVVDCGPPPTGACCLHDATGVALCVETTPGACAGEGGVYLGEGTICSSDPDDICGPPVAACCLPDGACLELPLEVCIMEGGQPLPGASCDTVDCPGSPIGACCLHDSTGASHCFESTADECFGAGGAFQGPGSTCPDDPNEPCGTPCDHLCPPGQFCFAGCGVLVQGVECVLFQADGGGLFILSNLGGFHVGDRVLVAGCHEPNCMSFCMQGDGCLVGNVIEPCGEQVCGGIAGIPCDDPDSFCKYPAGTCGMHDIFGVCTPVPGGCPDVWEPVCGCDGVTYGNECEADAVGVSIAHPGECRVVCEPAPDGFGCVPLACSPIPEDQCLVTAIGQNDAGLPFATVACECMNFNLCHFEYVPGGPVLPVGECPSGSTCDFVAHDTDGDGFDDLLTAECVPSEIGACCGDVGGSPMPIPDCGESTQEVCVGAGGVFAGIGTVCEPVEACCLVNQGDGACVEILPFCCEALDGIPRGPGSTCETACPQVCGGIAGIPCDHGEFCKLPEGTCNMSDLFGVCVPIPSGCPEIYAPVCGCDGVTYVNECEADAAGVSIDHPGECLGGDCAATRMLSAPDDAAHCLGITSTVRILLNPPAATSAIAVEDTPPAGWTVSNISEGGTFDAVNGKVKWGPLFAPFPAELAYDVTPTGASDTVCFAGAISVDGINQAICGNDCVDACCPHIAADVPQGACPACPVGDCTTCSDGACQDGHVSMCELVGYACAWMTGCNDDLAGVTRSAYVWRSGECYCWDDGQESWFPGSCTDSASVCCPGSGPGASGSSGSTIPVLGRAVVDVLPMRKSRSSRSRELQVPITIVAPEGTSAVGVECQVPTGWEVTAVTDGGVWDESHRKVKWGPFMDELSRTVSFKARRTYREVTAKTRRLKPQGRLDGFTGTVSFDGVNQPLTVE